MIGVDSHRVLLCGTQYGSVYLPAIYEDPSLDLSGILARGSARSRRLAEQAGVELYQQVDEIHEPIDLACIAIGGEVGVELGIAFLEKKVPVLIEHPISDQDYLLLLQAAQKNDSVCHINGHFADLPPARDFIEAATLLSREYRPHLINCTANKRTLYSLLDMLMRAFGAFELSNFTSQRIGDYTACTFLLNEIPVNLSFQNWHGAEDDSRDAPLGHQITTIYPIGTLSLTGTYGFSSWCPLVATIPAPRAPSAVISRNLEAQVIANITSWRIEANQKAMNQLLTKADHKVSHQSAPYLKCLTSVWSDRMAQLATSVKPDIPEIVPSEYWNPFRYR